MAIQTSAGSTLGVSAALPASETSGAYAALTFTTVGSISDLGSFGKTYNEVSFTPLASRRKETFKGSYSSGSLAVKLAKDVDDAGQDILLTALDSDNEFAFCVTLQDGTKEYFSGRVMSYMVNVGSVDQVTGADCNINITTDVIEV